MGGAHRISAADVLAVVAVCGGRCCGLALAAGRVCLTSSTTLGARVSLHVKAFVRQISGEFRGPSPRCMGGQRGRKSSSV